MSGKHSNKSGGSMDNLTKEDCEFYDEWKASTNGCCADGRPHAGYSKAHPPVEICVDGKKKLACSLTDDPNIHYPTDGADMSPPTWEIKSFDQHIKALSCPGPKGDTGADGPKGDDGADGKDAVVETCPMDWILPRLVDDYTAYPNAEQVSFYNTGTPVPADSQWHAVNTLTLSLADLQAMNSLDGNPAMRGTDNAVRVRIDTQASVDATAAGGTGTAGFAVTRHTVSACGDFFRRSAVRADTNTSGGAEEPTNSRIEDYIVPLDANGGATFLHELLRNAATDNADRVVSTMAVRVLGFQRIDGNNCYSADAPDCFGIKPPN